MNVFVAGATGAVGRRMIPLLLQAGHVVTAISRSAERLQPLERLGVKAIVCDVFDAAKLEEAVLRATPGAIIHQLTDLPANMDPRHIRTVYARNNRVRREGTRILVAAARRAAVRKFIVQSMGTWYRPEGSDVKSENDPLWTDAPEPIGEAVRTVVDMETAVLQGVAQGTVLRYGAFYGPGTWYAQGGEVVRRFQSRTLPIISAGGGITSFIQIDDAASAAVAALNGPPGVYNIADDDPARAAEWMPAFAAAVGAPPPRRIPGVLARLVLGKALTAWLTTMRGASNAKARRDLPWTLRFPTWRTGFQHGELNPP